MPTRERLLERVALALVVLFTGWSFVLALGLPLDSWDAYDYLVNARHLAGHDMARLAQTYRVDRPPGISLLVTPALWAYAPGQRGGAGLVHLVPWAIGLLGVFALWRALWTTERPALAGLGVVLFVMHPLMVHFLPFVMADVPSMTFSLLALIFADCAVSLRRGSDFVLLALCVAAAMLSKYPVAALGLAIPLANAIWTFAGRGRPTTWKGKLVSLVQPRLALPLLAGLALFLAVEAAIFSRFVPGDAGWWTKLSTGLQGAWGAAGGGSGGGETDPRWELPWALFVLGGAPVALLAGLGLVRTAVTRESRALLHACWVLVLLVLFVGVIGHKESRYAFPILPSLLWLAVYGLGWIRRPLAQAVLAAAALLGALGPSFAEFKRMHDPLYRAPSILAWARFGLERAGADRPIFQLPVLPQFALYPKEPVVLPMDEFWHYHHFNEGGLTWFFDRRFQALQAQPGAALDVRHESPWFYVTVPQPWLASVGEDAIWLGAFPKGAVLLSTAQGWYETRTAAQQPEPPAPFVAIDLQHVTLARAEASETTATFQGEGQTVRAARSAQGWAPVDQSGFTWFIREPDGTPRRWDSPRAELPGSVEGLRRETVTFPVR